MVKRLFLILLFLLPVTVNAADQYWQASLGKGTGTGSTPDAACSASWDWWKSTTTVFSHTVRVDSTWYYCYTKNLASGSTANPGSASLLTCPAARPYYVGPAQPENASQVCSGQPAPEVDPCADKNPFVRRWDYTGNASQSAPGHFGSCVVVPEKMFVCRKTTTGSYCMWQVRRTGERYTGPADGAGGGGTDTPESTTDPVTNSPPIEAPSKPTDQPGKGPCPEGTVHAGMSMSGIPMCIGQGSTTPGRADPPKNEITKNETQADGSTKSTTTATVKNGDGSTTKTVTTVVTRSDGSKETSQTVDTSKTPAGQPGSADTPASDDKYNLCKTNPNLSICRESKVQGECDQFMCIGDAVQCATAKAMASMQCQQAKDRKELEALPASKLGSDLMNGRDPEQKAIDEWKAGDEVDLSKTKLDQSGFIGSGSCFAPMTFAVMGRSVTAEFDSVCRNIEPLRYALMACAFIIVYLMVSKSILQG